MLALRRLSVEHWVDIDECDKLIERVLLQKQLDGIDRKTGYGLHSLDNVEHTYNNTF